MLISSGHYCKISVNAAMEKIHHNFCFKRTVMDKLCEIKNVLDKHSLILNHLLRHSQQSNLGSLIPPSNLPTFPIKSLHEFKAFDDLLRTDETVALYMTNRLAGIGGVNLESLTRRMLKYVMSNEVALLFNWKGREKESFEKTCLMKIFYDAARINFPVGERNDMVIENIVKDWLKYAKCRLSRISAK